MKNFLFVISLISIGCVNAQSDTTSGNDYFLTFVKKVYLNPTVYLRTQDFKETTNLGFVALPDLSSAQNNASSGFEKGLQKLLRLLMQTDGGVRFYFNPDNPTHPFTFWSTDNLHCKFKQPEKDSIDYYLNHAFSDSNLDLNNNQRFESTIDQTLDYIERVLAANPAECGEEPQNETTTINTKPLAINIHNTQGSKYDIDYKTHEQLASSYAVATDVFTQQQWYAPSKMFVTGKGAEPLTMSISLHDPQFKKENLKIELLKSHTVLSHTYTNDSIRFSLPENLVPSDPLEIVVKYKSQVDTINYTVGFFMVNVVEEQTPRLVLLGANGYTISSTDVTNIQNYLDKIYKPVGVAFDVSSNPHIFMNDYPTLIQDEGSGLLSNYPSDLHDYVGDVKDLEGYDNDNYYLVLGLNSTNAELLGYMPRARNIGFIFFPENASTYAVSTIAHELGHGAFHFRHIFDEEELGESSKGQTHNLMDDAEVLLKEALYLHQWRYIQDPAFVSWAGGDDADAQSLAAYLNFSDLSTFANPDDGSVTFLSPGNRPITLPSNTTAISFEDITDRWYYTATGVMTDDDPITGALVHFKWDGKVYHVRTENGQVVYKTDAGKYYKDTLSFKNYNTSHGLVPVIGTPVYTENSGFKLYISKCYKIAVPNANELKNKQLFGSLVGGFDVYMEIDGNEFYNGKEFPLANGDKLNNLEVNSMFNSLLFDTDLGEIFGELPQNQQQLLKTRHPEAFDDHGDLVDDHQSYKRIRGMNAVILLALYDFFKDKENFNACLNEIYFKMDATSIKNILQDDAMHLQAVPNYYINFQTGKYNYFKTPAVSRGIISLNNIVPLNNYFYQLVEPEKFDLNQRYYAYRVGMFFSIIYKLRERQEEFFDQDIDFSDNVTDEEFQYLYNDYASQQGLTSYRCQLMMLTPLERARLTRYIHTKWTASDNKEGLGILLIETCPMNDFPAYYSYLKKNNYDLMRLQKGDIWFSQFDEYVYTLCAKFEEWHKDDLERTDLPVFGLYHDGFNPFDAEVEYNFGDDGIELVSQDGFFGELNSQTFGPDQIVTFVLHDDFDFTGPHGQLKLYAGQRYNAPAFWAYWLLAENAQKTNTTITSKLVEAILIIVTLGAATPEVIAIEGALWTADLAIQIASDEMPHNETVQKIDMAFTALTLIIPTSAMVNGTKWITRVTKAKGVIFKVKPEAFSIFINSIKKNGTKLNQLSADLTKVVEKLNSLYQVSKKSSVKRFYDYFLNCKKETDLYKRAADQEYFDFVVDGDQLYVNVVNDLDWLDESVTSTFGSHIHIAEGLSIDNFGDIKFKPKMAEVTLDAGETSRTVELFDDVNVLIDGNYVRKAVDIVVTSKGKIGLIYRLTQTAQKTINKLNELVNLSIGFTKTGGNKYKLLDKTVAQVEDGEVIFNINYMKDKITDIPADAQFVKGIEDIDYKKGWLGGTSFTQMDGDVIFFKRGDEVFCLDGINCFTSGTLVSTIDGKKPIESLKVNDVVFSFDEKTKKKVSNRVTNFFVKKTTQLQKVIFGRDTIFTTPEHPFYVAGRWVKAASLTIGTLIQSQSGFAEVISNTTIEDTTCQVYNFTVENTHTYYVGAGEYLVHNKCSDIEDAINSVQDVAAKADFTAALTKSEKFTQSIINGTVKMEDILPILNSRKVQPDDIGKFVEDFGSNQAMMSKFISGELNVADWQRISKLDKALSSKLTNIELSKKLFSLALDNNPSEANKLISKVIQNANDAGEFGVNFKRILNSGIFDDITELGSYRKLLKKTTTNNGVQELKAAEQALAKAENYVNNGGNKNLIKFDDEYNPSGGIGKYDVDLGIKSNDGVHTYETAYQFKTNVALLSKNSIQSAGNQLIDAPESIVRIVEFRLIQGETISSIQSNQALITEFQMQFTRTKNPISCFDLKFSNGVVHRVTYDGANVIFTAL